MSESPLLKNYDDSFTVDAFFSRTPIEKPTAKLNGKITFSPNDKILSVHVSLDNSRFWEKNHIACVYGITSNKIYLKLTNLINTRMSGNLSTSFFIYTFYVNTCTLSEMPFNQKKSYTRKIDFSLVGFNTWFPVFERRKIDYLKRGGLKLSINLPSVHKIGSFTISDKKFWLKIYTELDKPSRFEQSYCRNLTVKSRVGCVISGHSNLSDIGVIKIVKDFEKLFAVLTGQRQQILFIRPFSEVNTEVNTKAIYTSQTTIRLSNVKDSIDPKYAFNYDTFGNTLDLIINNFFSRTENQNALITNYLMSINEDLDLSNELIDLCQAIDSYHEGIGKPYVLEERIYTLLNGFPKCITSILIENRNILLKDFLIKHRKGYLNEDDMKRNKNNILHFEDTLKIWARCISDTRKFLVHGNSKKSKFRIDDSVEKTRNTELLQFLVQCFILQQLGYSNFDRKELKDSLKRIITSEKYSII